MCARLKSLLIFQGPYWNPTDSLIVLQVDSDDGARMTRARRNKRPAPRAGGHNIRPGRQRRCANVVKMLSKCCQNVVNPNPTTHLAGVNTHLHNIRPGRQRRCASNPNPTTHLAGVNTHLAGVNTHLAGVNTHLAGVNTHLAGVNTAHLAGVNTHLARVNTHLAGINTVLGEHTPGWG
jgi:hypothetical protein